MGAFACEKCEDVSSGWVVLSPYLFDIKNEKKKIITVYGAILMYTLNDLMVWVLVTLHVFSWKPGRWVVNSMTSISVGLVIRLTSLFVVSLHPGIKMVRYPQPISSLGVILQWSVIPSRAGKGGGGNNTSRCFMSQKEGYTLAIWACFPGSPSSKSREKTACTKTHKMVVIALAHLTGKQWHTLFFMEVP